MVIKTIESHMTLTLKDPQLARIIENALKPEITMDIGQRSNTSLTRKGNIIEIAIKAPDTTSMRASMNSLLRWISMIQRIQNI